LFAAVLAEQPTRPLVTFYDDAVGERIELSARSLANWIAKTHFLLTDELGVGPGDSALIALPADWVTVAVMLGCWSAGLSLTSPGTPGSDEAVVAFVQPATVDLATTVPDVYCVNPASMTRSFPGAVPGGASDYVSAVRPQPDSWAGVHSPAGADDEAVPGLTRVDLLASVTSRIAALGLAPGDRVLVDQAWTGPASWIDGLLAPIAVGGSIVLVANADLTDQAKRARRIEQEHITATNPS
jgi:uncharacterized protein (TIGR03089 family)